MYNPIRHFLDYQKYKKAIIGMRLSANRAKEIPSSEDGVLSGDDEKLFNLYTSRFFANLKTVRDYEQKYSHKKKG